MNSKTIKVSLLIGASALFFIAGCGPQDFQDINNAQNANGEILNKDVKNAPPMKADQDQAPEESGGCPAGGCQAGGGDGGCPTGQCEIPPDADTQGSVQLPDQVRTQPTKIIPTAEKQIATDTVDYHTTHHVWQPSERHHRVHKHRNLVRRHFTKVVYHPTFRRINSVVTTGSSEDQVMPTEEVVAPVVDYGCSNAVPAPQPVAVVPMVVRPVYYVRGLLGRF